MFRPVITFGVNGVFSAPSNCALNPCSDSPDYRVWVVAEGEKKSFVAQQNVMEPLLNSLQSIALPIAERWLVVFDAPRYELSIRFSDTVTYTWEQALPQEWSALKPPLARISDLTGIYTGIENEQV